MQGDSGFMLVRGGDIVFKSPVLQHFFDCPFQVRAAGGRAWSPSLAHVPSRVLGPSTCRPGNGDEAMKLLASRQPQF